MGPECNHRRDLPMEGDVTMEVEVGMTGGRALN